MYGPLLYPTCAFQLSHLLGGAFDTQVQRGATVAPGAVEYTDAGGVTCRLAFGAHDLTVRERPEARCRQLFGNLGTTPNAWQLATCGEAVI